MKNIIQQQICRKHGLILKPIFAAKIMELVCPEYFSFYTKTHSYFNTNFIKGIKL